MYGFRALGFRVWVGLGDLNLVAFRVFGVADLSLGLRDVWALRASGLE